MFDDPFDVFLADEDKSTSKTRLINPITMEYAGEEDSKEEAEETILDRICSLKDDLVRFRKDLEFFVIDENSRSVRVSETSRYTPNRAFKFGDDVARPTRSMKFFNNTGKTITVIYRDNIKVELTPVTGVKPSMDYVETPLEKEHRGLIVEVTDKVPVSQTHSYIANLVASDSDFITTVADEAIEILSNKSYHHPGTIHEYVDIKYYHIIDGGYIEEKVATYLKDLDLGIFFGHSAKAPDHPLCKKDSLNTLGLTSSASECFSLLCEIVDNDDLVCKNKYMHVSGVAAKIPVVQDSLRENGLYVTIGDASGTDTKMVSLDKLTEFGIFDTVEEAVAGGNMSARQEKELQTLVLETERLKRENSKAKEEIESRMLKVKEEHDKKIKELDLESKQKLADLKERYEKEKTEREARLEKLKTTNNILKAAVAVTTSIIGIIVLVTRTTEV